MLSLGLGLGADSKLGVAPGRCQEGCVAREAGSPQCRYMHMVPRHPCFSQLNLREQAC